MADNENKRRISALYKKQARPRFGIGALVDHQAHGVGVVDAIFADLAAASDYGVIPVAWLAMQERKPKTSAEGIWYGVILSRGAILAGELDLAPVLAAVR